MWPLLAWDRRSNEIARVKSSGECLGLDNGQGFTSTSSDKQQLFVTEIPVLPTENRECIQQVNLPSLCLLNVVCAAHQAFLSLEYILVRRYVLRWLKNTLGSIPMDLVKIDIYLRG